MMDLLQLENEFAGAWDDPANLRIELPSIDVNAVLDEGYRLSEPLTFTRTMLWDMEVRKARRPDLYIPAGVIAGSAQAWVPEPRNPGGDDVFVRVSQQRLVADPGSTGTVIERVGVDHLLRKVVFLGTAAIDGEDGAPVRGAEPLFHVEHGTAGTEDRPLNTMRWVFLTAEHHDAVAERLNGMAAGDRLPEYLEIYIRDVLGIGLERLGR